MRAQAPAWLVGGFALLVSASGSLGQGTFQNLDFESANLSPVPGGQYGGFVPITNALPGWSGYIGANQVTTVLQNAEASGNASIDILGPNWRFGGIIEGQYTVVLQPGLDPFGSDQNVGASISQSGVVPASAQSLQFKAQTGSFSVSLGGQNLSLIPLGTGANYTLYGANISPSFAGQFETLVIATLAAPSTTDYFDSIGFSSWSVPEPSALGLSAFGALLLGWRVLRRRDEA